MIAAQPQYDGFNITFQVTEDCNLRCRYCYETGKRPGDLPLDYAQRFIDLILTDDNPIGLSEGDPSLGLFKRGIILDFIGGDALMRPQLCDQIISYFMFRASELRHRWANRWRCAISTNGTLLGEPDVRQFLLKYRENISLGISVDGCPTIHNYNRSNSMDAILRNWDWYMWYSKGYGATKATLNKESIPYIADSVEYLHGTLGLKYINMNFIFEDMGLTEDDYAEIDRQLAGATRYILGHADDLHVNMFSKEFGIGDLPSEESLSRGWCGAGAMPCVSVNGKIYPCFRFTPITMRDDALDFSVGNVFDGFTRKDRFGIVRSQTRSCISPEKCLSCPAESTCAWCIGGAYAKEGVFHRPVDICRIHRMIDHHSREYWNAYNRMKGIGDVYIHPTYKEASQ